MAARGIKDVPVSLNLVKEKMEYVIGLSKSHSLFRIILKLYFCYVIVFDHTCHKNMNNLIGQSGVHIFIYLKR